MDTAVDLTVHKIGIDDGAAAVDGYHLFHGHLAGIHVHIDLGDLGTKGVALKFHRVSRNGIWRCTVAGEGGLGQHGVTVEPFRSKSGFLHCNVLFGERFQIDHAVFNVEFSIIRYAQYPPRHIKKLISGVCSGFLHAVSHKVDGAGGAGSFVKGSQQGVAGNKVDFFYGNAQNFGGQLAQSGFGALSHIA